MSEIVAQPPQIQTSEPAEINRVLIVLYENCLRLARAVREFEARVAKLENP